MKQRFDLPYTKIVSLNKAEKSVKLWQRQGLKIVVTAGVFDIATFKHPEYLRVAANMGDKLIVRVDTDKLVSDEKYPKGPIIKWKLRCKHVAHYPYVDLIVPNPGGTAWIKKIRPSLAVYSITTSPRILDEINEMQQNFNLVGTKVIILDTKFKSVPKNLVIIKARNYQKTKFNQKNFSGSVVRKEIVKRGLSKN